MILGLDNIILHKIHLTIQSRAKGATVREVTQTSAVFVVKICDTSLLNVLICVKADLERNCYNFQCTTSHFGPVLLPMFQGLSLVA